MTSVPGPVAGETTRWTPAAATVAAVGAAFGLSALMIAVTGGSPSAAMHAVWQGGLASQAAWSSTLLYAAPLLMVAVGTSLSARAGMFNIGQEGQVLIGATAAAWVALRLAITGPALVVTALLAAVVAGGAWAGLSALMLRVRGVNVVVSTLLMIFVAQQLVSYVVSTSWLLQESTAAGGIAGSESNPLPGDARLPTAGAYPHLQVNAGLVVAAACVVVVGVLLVRTRWGFRLRMLGLNPRAARHAGVRVTLTGGLALAVSGALAGLAGATVLASPLSTGRLDPGISNNIGWDGLLVALIARNRPAATVPVALGFGALRAGGDFLAATGVPTYVVDVVKALLVLAFVTPAPLVEAWRGRRPPGRRAPAPQATPAPPVEVAR
jgi:simple sugar transport system permease protein